MGVMNADSIAWIDCPWSPCGVSIIITCLLQSQIAAIYARSLTSDWLVFSVLCKDGCFADDLDMRSSSISIMHSPPFAPEVWKLFCRRAVNWKVWAAFSSWYNTNLFVMYGIYRKEVVLITFPVYFDSYQLNIIPVNYIYTQCST